MQQRYRKRGDQRRLLGRLGDHAVAGGKRRRHLAEKDRQREVPRTDADEHAAAAIAQHIAFAGRPRHRLAARERAARLQPRNSGNNPPPRAIRRAHRRASCRPRPAAAQKPAAIKFEPVGGALEHRGALARPASPPRPAKPAAAAATAARASPSSASLTTPIALPSIGECTGRARRPAAASRRSAARRGRPCARRRRALRASSASRLARSPNSMPAELRRVRPIKIARQRNFAVARLGRRRRSSFADGARCRRSARSDRRRRRRRTSWRRFPEAGAPDRPSRSRWPPTGA